MTDGTNGPANDPAPAPTPASAPPSPTRQLDRAPGERYRAPAGGAAPGRGPGAAARGPAASSAAGGPAAGTGDGATTASGGQTRAILAGAGAAGGGALLYAGLGQIDLGLGLLAVAAFIGWVVAIAIVWGAGEARPIPRQPIVAALLGAGAIVLGLLLAWAWSRTEGGVLGPLDYTDQRYGPVAYLEILVAGAVAGLRAR